MSLPRLGPAAIMGVALSLSAHAARATPDPRAYAATFPNPNDASAMSDYGVVDLNTGGFTAISPLPFSAAGFAQSGAYLYTAPYGAQDNDYAADPNFYRLTPSTGALQIVSAGGLDGAGSAFLGLGSTLSGMYALGADPTTGDFDLFTITASGTSSLIGSTGLTPPSGEASLSTGSATLFLASGNELYTIDTSTGSATDIGSIGPAGDGFAALTQVGPTLYGAYVNDQFTDATSQLYTLTTTPPGGGLPGATVLPANGQIYALAPVPEPPVWTTLLIGFGVVGAGLRTRATQVSRDRPPGPRDRVDVRAPSLQGANK